MRVYNGLNWGCLEHSTSVYSWWKGKNKVKNEKNRYEITGVRVQGDSGRVVMFNEEQN